MEFLKQSTAVTVLIGPFLDETSGKDAEIALTIAQADVRLSKNGGNMAQKGDATSCTHDELGYYTCPLSTTDTGTMGILKLMVHESGALPIFHSFMVLPANVYDSICSTDKLEVDLFQMGGVAQSATDLKDFADAGYDPATNKIEACKVNDDMVGTDSAALAATALSNATWTDAKAGYLDHAVSTVDTVVDGIQTDLSNATDGLGALKTLIDTVNTDLSNGTDGLGALKTLIDALNDVSTSDLATALTNIHLDHLLAADYDPASKPGAATALMNELVESDAGVSRFTTNALEQGPGGGSGLSAQETRDAMKLAPTGGAPSAGSLDLHLDTIEADTGTTLENHLTAIKGGTFDGATDSLEALRNRGDAAWITGGGGSISDILNVQPLIPNAVDLANTATVKISLGLTNMLDDLPSTAEIVPGTITIDRKAIGGTSWANIVNAAACSEAAGLIYYDEVFDSGTGYVAGDTIRVTFKNQKINVAANDYEITGTDGWVFHTYIREAMRGTESAALATVCTETRLAEMDAANLPADVAGVPTVAEFEARSIAAADYVVVGDTIAGVTTCTTNTDMVGTDNAALASGVQLSAQGKLDVNAEADTALTDYGANTTVPDAAGIAATPAEVAIALTNIHLDHLLAADYDPTSKPGVATALLNELVENDAGVSRYTANALEQAPSGTGASAATIADAVWDEAIADHAAGASFGAKNQKVVPSETLVDYKATGFNTVVPDAAGVAPTVGEIRTEMEGAGTKLTFALEDTNELQTNQGDWATATGFSTHSAANVRTEMDSNSTKMTSIEADTQDIQSRIPAALATGRMSSDAVAISGSTDAADKLEASAETIVPATVNDAGASTTVFITDLSSAVDDFYNGRVLIFVDGALAFQATAIEDYNGTTKAVTVVALTAAPANAVGFVVV